MQPAQRGANRPGKPVKIGADRDGLCAVSSAESRSGVGEGMALPRVAMVSTHGYVASAPPLGAADTGGQVVYVLELSKKLAQLGYEVDIWTRRFEDQPATEQVADRVRILRVPCGGAAFIAKEYLCQSLPEWVANAVQRMRQEGLSYRFVNSHYWDGGLAAQQLCAVLEVPHVHTPHSLGAWKQREMLRDYPDDADKFERTYNFGQRNQTEKHVYAEATLVVATTPDQVDLLTSHYEVPKEKVKMIPPGYDDTRFYPVGSSTREVLRRKLGFEGKVILSLGRIARNKGYDLLIRGFAEVAKRDGEARLHLAIGGERLEAAEAQILGACRGLVDDLGLGDKVVFSGFVPEAEMADLYRAADVFVLSSRYEPFGMTAVEAMACGTPTVVTTHGGLFRVLRFGISGLFADTFDAMDLGITILKPLQYPRLRERLSRRGAQTARSLFTWTGIAQQLIAATEKRDAGVALSELEPATAPIQGRDS
jgi:mannosylfructose-phosphate synthase